MKILLEPKYQRAPAIPAHLIDSCNSRVWAIAWETAIKEHVAQNTLIKSVNLRNQAQPYLDELIGEIDGLPRFAGERGESVIYIDDLNNAIDKYRSKP